ncbi:MAG: O-antigen ligase family protein [Nitrobacter sp.]
MRLVVGKFIRPEMMRATYQPGWRKIAEFFLIGIFTTVAIAVTIRYRLSQNTLPVAVAALIFLALVAPDARVAMRDVWIRAGRSWLGKLACILATWMLLSSFWAPDPHRSFTRSLTISLLIAIAITCSGALRTVRKAQIFPWLVIATVVAITFAVFNLLTSGIARTLINCCREGMQPDKTGSAIAIALTAWPAAGWLVLTGRKAAAALLVALAAALVFSSNSGASGIAIVAALVTVALGSFHKRAAVLLPLLIVLSGFATALTLGKLDNSLLSFNLGERLAAFHANERIQIWAYYTDFFWQRPWTGFGFNAEHTLGNPVLYKHYTTTIPPHFANLHTHNVELQVLLEFGVIGAVLVILTMCAGVARYWNDTRPEIVFFMAALSALAGATLVNFGLWEEWLLGVIAMTAILSVRLLQPDLPLNISEKPDSAANS